MKLIEFKLESGRMASFYLDNNIVICGGADEHISLFIANAGSWKLHESYTYEDVIKAIKEYN